MKIEESLSIQSNEKCDVINETNESIVSSSIKSESFNFSTNESKNGESKALLTIGSVIDKP